MKLSYRIVLFVLGLSLVLATVVLLSVHQARPPQASDLARPPHEIIAASNLYYLGADRFSGTTSFAIKTRRGILVIDPGWDYGKLKAAFLRLGLDVRDVRVVLVTHMHADHWFCARELVRESGATVMAHSDDAALLVEAADLAHYYSFHRPMFRTVPTLSEVRSLQDGEVIELGELKVEVIATPGHTRGSVCFRSTIRGHSVLWTGDTVDSLVADSIGGLYATRLGPRFGGDMKAYLASLHRLATIPADIVLPGHHARTALARANPRLGAEGWRRLLAPNTARLEGWLRDHPLETDQFLDGTPKLLAPEIVYLGEHASTASYVLKTGDGMVLIDPGRRAIEQLESLLESLSLSISDVKIVLLTSLHPDHSKTAAELCSLVGATLMCGAMPQDISAQEGVRVLDHGVELRVGAATITVLAGRAGSGDRCFLIQLGGRSVLAGGDTVSRFPLADGDEYHASLDKLASAVASADFPETCRLLKQRPVEIVLPAHPRFDESPHYLPGEWGWLTYRWDCGD
jgi:glyoxylase-like metal-dependent hydrolase (beta-lactamase superfamily II)